ncbi:MAG: hypothetical protein JEZ00_02670 [Anaerolineaceae bacterium]|nr:hypothetical protein [Anaerolineaceae bacterium]
MFDQEEDFNGIPDEDRIWAAAAYAFSPIAPLLIMLLDDQKDIPFVKAHLMQALTIGILYVFITLITLGCGAILWLGLLYSAFKAYQGETFQIPFIYEFIEKQGWLE